MQSQVALIACHSVVELHQWIEEVFTGREGYPAALNKLLDSFCPDFRMVTTNGQSVGFAAVESLFRQKAGARPDLRIVIDACEVLQVTVTSAVCRYRETHYDNGHTQARWSVAMIEVNNAKPRWHYLHETAIANL